MSKPIKKLSVANLQQQVGELTEALQRERADALNIRRRAEEDQLKMADFYKSMIIKELLPAIDNLERSLLHTPKDLAGHDYVKGVQGVVKQFEKALKELGVQRIKTIGEEFDPKLHEAISIEDGRGGVEVVCEELQPGYKLGDQVIRHAIVKVKRETTHD
ncbi:nucleotide exchange factor GrpE [Candidatus Saccharibacteria bacterium CG10_big_fil_rev_8_21_14_0_10_47_8]|nr:MAG: nucleotide exchange factor GrpE [Candidatus Saccharibacteria bacterium CG10_big_fil_rev_8_21_14_0_10_47_8]